MHKAILLFPLALAACGGSPSSSGPAMFSLRAAGVNPSTISVMGGAQLQFTNEDTAFQGTVIVEQSSTVDAGYAQ